MTGGGFSSTRKTTRAQATPRRRRMSQLRSGRVLRHQCEVPQQQVQHQQRTAHRDLEQCVRRLLRGVVLSRRLGPPTTAAPPTCGRARAAPARATWSRDWASTSTRATRPAATEDRVLQGEARANLKGSCPLIHEVRRCTSPPKTSCSPRTPVGGNSWGYCTPAATPPSSSIGTSAASSLVGIVGVCPKPRPGGTSV